MNATILNKTHIKGVGQLDKNTDTKTKDVTFDEYKKWFNKYRDNKDTREINFQNGVVRKLIERLFPNLDIEDVSIKGPYTENHDYLQYCGTYINSSGREIATTPDLVIAKNWNWLNKENTVDYRAVVEVKSPYSYDNHIYNKGYEEYYKFMKIQLRRHLSSTNNNKLIFTDAMKWEFYTKDDNGLVPVRTFKLYDLTNTQGGLQLEKEGEPIVGDENDPLKEEFEKLKNFLKKFLE